MFVMTGNIPINYVVWVSSKLGTKKLFFFLGFNPYPVLINTFLDSVFDALSNGVFVVEYSPTQNFQKLFIKEVFLKTRALQNFRTFHLLSSSIFNPKELIITRRIFSFEWYIIQAYLCHWRAAGTQ